MEDLISLNIIGTIITPLVLQTSPINGCKHVRFSVLSICDGYKKYNNIAAFNDIAEKLVSLAKEGDKIDLWASINSSKNRRTHYYETGIFLYKFKIDNTEVTQKQNIEITDDPNDLPEDFPYK